MARIEKNGWWSFFSRDEQAGLAEKNPQEIVGLMLNDQEIALRFIQEFVAHNQRQTALNIINAFPEEKKDIYIENLLDMVPTEIMVWRDTGLFSDSELKWYARDLPLLLLLGYNGFTSDTPTRDLSAYTQVSNLADQHAQIILKSIDLL